jgi:hypothetical protein
VSWARTFFSTSTGPTNPPSGWVVGEIIEFRKSTRYRSTRTRQYLSDILHATMPELPRLNSRKPSSFFLGQGSEKVLHVLFYRRIQSLREYKCHPWPPMNRTRAD